MTQETVVALAPVVDDDEEFVSTRSSRPTGWIFSAVSVAGVAGVGSVIARAFFDPIEEERRSWRLDRELEYFVRHDLRHAVTRASYAAEAATSLAPRVHQLTAEINQLRSEVVSMRARLDQVTRLLENQVAGGGSTAVLRAIAESIGGAMPEAEPLPREVLDVFFGDDET